MVIGIDASRANHPDRTGTEWYSLHVLRGMVGLDRSLTFRLYLESPPVQDLKNLGPNVEYRILSWPLRFLWSQLRLSLEMLLHRPDALFIPAHTIPVIHPSCTVVTIHDVGFEQTPQLYGSRFIGGRGVVGVILNALARCATLGRYGNSELDYHRWSARYAARHARQIITVSEYSKQEIQRNYRIDPRHTTVIHHGIDTDVFHRSSPENVQSQLRKFGIREPYLLAIGRLERKKNIGTLLDAFTIAHRVLPELSLVLIGSPGLGWNEERVRMERNGIVQYVHQLGWQPTETSVPLLSGASSLVFLSRYEGFGLPILEAFATETPVICSRIPALLEIGGNAVMSIDVDDVQAAADAMVRCVRNARLRTSLISSGSDRIRLFRWNDTAAATLSTIMTAFTGSRDRVAE